MWIQQEHKLGGAGNQTSNHQESSKWHRPFFWGMRMYPVIQAHMLVQSDALLEKYVEWSPSMGSRDSVLKIDIRQLDQPSEEATAVEDQSAGMSSKLGGKAAGCCIDKGDITQQFNHSNTEQQINGHHMNSEMPNMPDGAAEAENKIHRQRSTGSMIVAHEGSRCPLCRSLVGDFRRAYMRVECSVCLEEVDQILVSQCGHTICINCASACSRLSGCEPEGAWLPTATHSFAHTLPLQLFEGEGVWDSVTFEEHEVQSPGEGGMMIDSPNGLPPIRTNTTTSWVCKNRDEDDTPAGAKVQEHSPEDENSQCGTQCDTQQQTPQQVLPVLKGGKSDLSVLLEEAEDACFSPLASRKPELTPRPCVAVGSHAPDRENVPKQAWELFLTTCPAPASVDGNPKLNPDAQDAAAMEMLELSTSKVSRKIQPDKQHSDTYTAHVGTGHTAAKVARLVEQTLATGSAEAKVTQKMAAEAQEAVALEADKVKLTNQKVAAATEAPEAGTVEADKIALSKHKETAAEEAAARLGLEEEAATQTAAEDAARKELEVVAIRKPQLSVAQEGEARMVKEDQQRELVMKEAAQEARREAATIATQMAATSAIADARAAILQRNK